MKFDVGENFGDVTRHSKMRNNCPLRIFEKYGYPYTKFYG